MTCCSLPFVLCVCTTGIFSSVLLREFNGFSALREIRQGIHWKVINEYRHTFIVLMTLFFEIFSVRLLSHFPDLFSMPNSWNCVHVFTSLILSLRSTSFYLHICLSIHLSTHLHIYFRICLSDHLKKMISVHTSAYLRLCPLLEGDLRHPPTHHTLLPSLRIHLTR